MANNTSETPGSSRGLWVALGALVMTLGMLFSAAVWIFLEYRDAQNWRSQAHQMSAVAEAALSDLKAINELKAESQRERLAMQKAIEDLRTDMQRNKDEITARMNNIPNNINFTRLTEPPVANVDGAPQARFLPRRVRPMRLQPVNNGARSWGPEQAIGEPDTLVAGDATTAWASRTADGQPEWLYLEYPKISMISKVKIHETQNPGAVVRITVPDDGHDEIEIWKGVDPTPRNTPMGVSTIDIPKPVMGNRVKIYLDSQNVPGWNEIDAVGIEDDKGVTQYANRALASSTYAELNDPQVQNLAPLGFREVEAQQQGRSWGTEQATGAPNVFAAGDNRNAWASRAEDGQPEWLILEYEKPVKISKVKVCETYNPGALSKVTVFDEKGVEMDAWQGKDPTPAGAGMGTSTVNVNIPQLSKKIKIYLDSQNVPGWNEIDAVGIEDEKGNTQWATRCVASSCYADPDQGMVKPNAVAPVQEQF